MENKMATILLLTSLVALAVTVGGAYAMGGQTASHEGPYGGMTSRSGTGSSMMGGTVGNSGMMASHGGYGMMGDRGYSMMQTMRQYMWHYWTSTTVP